MLKKRIISAIILLPIFVLLVLKLSPQAFCIFTGLFVIAASVEWSHLMGVKKFPSVLIYPTIMAILVMASLFLSVSLVLTLGFIWWLAASLLVIIYPSASQFWGKGIVIRSIMGFLVLIPCWQALNVIRNSQNGAYALLFLFVLIWGADTAAYFVGRKWGKHKLAPVVSPGKSWEGFIGAIFGTFLICFVTFYLISIPYQIWLVTIGLALITVIFSVMGDLFESMLKRKADLKDSGNIIPGHGGILDRIDSLTAAAPVFAFGALLLGKFYH